MVKYTMREKQREHVLRTTVHGAGQPPAPSFWRAPCQGRVTVAKVHTVDSERDVNYYIEQPPPHHGLVDVEAVGTSRWFAGDSYRMTCAAFAIELITAGRAEHATRECSTMVEPGCIIVKRPGEWCSLRACSKEMRRMYLRFFDEHASSVFRAFGLDKLAAVKLPAAFHAEACSLFEECMALMRERQPGFEHLLSVAAFKVLDATSRAAFPPPVSTLPETLERAVTYADLHLAELHSVGALADHLAISQEHLTRLFKRHVGMSPRRWLEARRIESACHLLAHSNARIEDVAGRAGYCDLPPFHRAFRRVVGMTPIAYRRMRRGDTPKKRTAAQLSASRTQPSPARQARAAPTVRESARRSAPHRRACRR